MARRRGSTVFLLLLAASCCAQARPFMPPFGRTGGAGGAGGSSAADGGGGGSGMLLQHTTPPATCVHTTAYGSVNYDRELSDGIADVMKNCDAKGPNVNCPPCELYRNHIVNGKTCKSEQTSTCGPASGDKGYWFTSGLVLPKLPVRGIEDVSTLNPDYKTVIANTKHLWEAAWKKHSLGDMGALVINSPQYRSEHQMHIHIGNMGKSDLFYTKCYPKIVATNGVVNSWKTSQPFTCDVQAYKSDGHGHYQPSGTVTAQLRAKPIDSLDDVWNEYLAAMASGGVQGQGQIDVYHTGLAVVSKTINHKPKYFVVLFSGVNGKGVGDYQIYPPHN